MGLATWSDDYCAHFTDGDAYGNCVSGFLWGAAAAQHDRELDKATIEEGITFNTQQGSLSYDYDRKDLVAAMKAGRDRVVAEGA